MHGAPCIRAPKASYPHTICAFFAQIDESPPFGIATQPAIERATKKRDAEAPRFFE